MVRVYQGRIAAGYALREKSSGNKMIIKELFTQGYDVVKNRAIVKQERGWLLTGRTGYIRLGAPYDTRPPPIGTILE